MPLVRTDLRDTRPRAKEISYSPAPPITARNVQDAITQAAALASGGIAPPSITPTFITFAASPYAVQATDYLILVDTSGGPVTINMMASAARNKKRVTVKDLTGNASVNNISVVRNGVESIDGLTTYPIATDYDAKEFDPVNGGYVVT